MAEQVLPAGVADLLKVSDETTIIEQPYEAIGTAYNLISVGGLTDPMAELVTALAEDCQSCGGGFGPGGPPPPPPPFPPGPIPPRLELTIPQQ
jgi:hypothetical protein